MRKEIIGVILISLLASGVVYYTWDDAGVKIRIDEDKTTMYLKNDNNRYVVYAREYGSLWDFPSKMNRDLKNTYTYTKIDNLTNISTTTRITTYQRGAIIKDTYILNGSNTNLEHFPESHKIEIYNASGYVYQYEVRDLKYSGITKKYVDSPVIIGRIKIEFEQGYWNKLYKSGILKVRYNIDSDYFVLYNKVVDPEWSTNDLISNYYFAGDINDSQGVNDFTHTGGATLTTDRDGNVNSAYDFDDSDCMYGNSSFAGLKDLSSSDLHSNWTISFWMYSRDLDGGENHIFSHFDDTDYYLGIYVYTTSGDLHFKTYKHRIVGEIFHVVNQVQENEWVHVTMVHTSEYKGTTDGKAEIYLNGTLVASDTTRLRSTSTARERTLYLGCKDGGSGYWDGKLDDINIWNVSLNSTQIYEIYDDGLKVDSYLNMFINSKQNVINAEYGSALNISAYVKPDGLEVCLDSEHPDYGYNYTCGTGSVEFEWNVSSGSRYFNDSSSEVNVTTQKKVYLSSIRNNSNLNTVSGKLYSYSTTNHTRDIYLDYDSDGDIDFGIWGNYSNNVSDAERFNNSMSNYELNYTGAGVEIGYLRVPIKYNSTEVTLNLSPSTNLYFEDDLLHWVAITEDGYGLRTFYPNVIYAKDVTSSSDFAYLFGGSCLDFQVSGKTCNGTYTTAIRYTLGGGYDSIERIKNVPYELGTYGGGVYKEDSTYMYVFGGYNDTYQNKLVRYNIPTGSIGEGTWTELSNMPISTSGFSYVYMGNKIYVFGGLNSSGYMNSTMIYNISDSTWYRGTNLPDYQTFGWAEVYNTTHIMTYGGRQSSTTLSTAGYTYLYDTVNDIWYNWGQLSSRPYLNNGFKLGEDIYLYGGYRVHYTDNGLLKFNRITESWDIVINSTSSYDLYNNCFEKDYYGVCIGSGFFGNGFVEETIKTLPYQVSLQVGNYENTSFSNTTTLTNTVNIGDISTELNYNIQDCDIIEDQMCILPIYISNQGAGIINLTGLTQVGEVGSFDFANGTVSCDTTYCNQSIDFTFGHLGENVEFRDIYVSYNGTKNVTWTARTEGNDSNSYNSTDQIVNVFYSNFTRNYPYDWISKIIFLPSEINESNVTPFKQTSSMPILNLSGVNNDRDYMLSVSVSNLTSCLNITASNSSNKYKGINLTSAYTNLSNLTKTGYAELWLWLDINCSTSADPYYIPQINIQSCCDNCEACN